MAVQNLPVEVNSFVRGLVTEASPLTFPENASLDEVNFVLNRDGSRRRRLGMSLISPLQTITGSFEGNAQVNSFYEWENVGGNADKTFTVSLIGNSLVFFDASDSSSAFPVFVESEDISNHVQLTGVTAEVADMTSVDGILVVAFKEKDILIVKYENDTLIYETTRLKIRDLFGLEDPYTRTSFSLGDGTGITAKTFNDLLDGEATFIRPYELTNTHLYNLRNQSWGRLRDGLFIREDGGNDVNLRKDPIDSFDIATNLKDPVLYRDGLISLFPSNADAVGIGLIDYAEIKGAPERFVPTELGETPRSSSASPKGFFIIDALDRGASREEQHRSLLTEGKSQFVKTNVGTYPQDITPRGASCVEEFAGRVWYGGFTGDVIDGDSRSPRMASYVLYSQLVQDFSNINKCYQQNDPTYEQEADLLATDGGFIRLDGAYGISKMVNLGSAILVYARNGVWSISGGTDVGFTAEAYIVKKLTDQGIAGANSVVEVGGSSMYWGDNGIYLVTPNQVGQLTVQNISQEVIQKFYENIPIEERLNASGVFDKYENKVRWLYGDKSLGSASKELIFDLSLQAFYPSVIKPVDANSPYLLHPSLIPPYKVGRQLDDVVVGANLVEANAEQVIVDSSVALAGQREIAYLTIWSTSPLQIGYSAYTDTGFVDFPEYNGGTDAQAHVITGYGPSGDFQRRKQVPYLTAYLIRTEDGFQDVSGDLQPTSESSCKLQARWEWANSATSNKWGREFEIYRYNRFYLPEDIDDTYDTGMEVITTKNKLRGHGKTLSLKFTTSPKKDCRLLGWSMVVGVSTSV